MDYKKDEHLTRKEKKVRPYKMQVRTFLKDGVPTYQTVATKGKEVIPFWYNGDIIYLGLGSDHPQHDRDFKIVQECLDAYHTIDYRVEWDSWNTIGRFLSWELEQQMEKFGYKRDEYLTRDMNDLSIEFPHVICRKVVDMLSLHKDFAKVQEFQSIGHYAKRKA